MMLFDSHRIKSPSLMRGHKAVGIHRHDSMIVVAAEFATPIQAFEMRPSSPQHHSTFCTLEESVLPHILIMMRPP